MHTSTVGPLWGLWHRREVPACRVSPTAVAPQSYHAKLLELCDPQENLRRTDRSPAGAMQGAAQLLGRQPIGARGDHFGEQ